MFFRTPVCVASCCIILKETLAISTTYQLLFSIILKKMLHNVCIMHNFTFLFSCFFFLLQKGDENTVSYQLRKKSLEKDFYKFLFEIFLKAFFLNEFHQLMDYFAIKRSLPERNIFKMKVSRWWDFFFFLCKCVFHLK